MIFLSIKSKEEMTKINNEVSIQFVKGKKEKDNPEIRLFRNRDGKQGQAIYKFNNATTITIENFKSIQKMYLIDEEGEILTKKIDLAIKENYIKEVRATYNWYSEKEFERFMRFAIRYAKSITNK